jgi:hypothetical protein
MSKSVFPRPEVEDAPARARKATAPMPRWVMVTLLILLLGVLLFLILHFTGHGMGHMQMSIPELGRYAL